MNPRTCRACGAPGLVGRSVRYCDACRAGPRCASCAKVGGGHLQWCPLAHQVPTLAASEPRSAIPIQAIDLGWAAGFLEGEGSFPANATAVTACQKQREPLDRLRRLFGGRVYWRPEGGTYGIYAWYLHGPSARGVMMTLFSLMSPRRKAQIRGALMRWRDGAYRGQGHRARRAMGYAEVT